MRPFSYVEPRSLQEACAALREAGDGARLIAGGTALVLFMKQGIFTPETLVSLRHVPGLNRIEAHDGGLRIGGMVTLRQLELDPLVQERFPVLGRTARRIGNVRVRNMATVGGNLAYADSHLDLPALLICLDAIVETARLDGERAIPIESFFVDYYQSALGADEILTGIHLPAMGSDMGAAYEKFTPLSGDDWPCVGVAAAVRVEGGRVTWARVAANAVANTPVRLRAVEEALLGAGARSDRFREAAALAADGLEPLPNHRGSTWYKKEMLRVHTYRALLGAWRATGAGLEPV